MRFSSSSSISFSLAFRRNMNQSKSVTEKYINRAKTKEIHKIQEFVPKSENITTTNEGGEI